MISLDSVVALSDGFVTADRLNDSQYIKSSDGKSYLKHIEYALMGAVLVCTEHYDLICSFSQKILSEGNWISAGDLKEGDIIDTVDSIENGAKQEKVTKIVVLSQYIDMAGLHIKSGNFLANGFILKGDNYGKN